MAFVIEDGVLFEYKEEPGVTDVVIPDGVREIGWCAFSECTNITSITIPESVDQIDWEYKGYFEPPAVFGYHALEIHVSPKNPTYASKDGVLFDKSLKCLQFCPRGRKGEYVVPEGVTDICEFAFSACTELTKVIIPNGVTGIWEGAFMNCTGLTDITIPGSVETIKGRVFASDNFYVGNRCMSLTNVILSEGLTSIGSEMFSGCSKLTGITIPKSVTSIGEEAFIDCTNLTDITFLGSDTKIDESAFCGCKNLTHVTAPEGFNYEAFACVDDMPTPWLMEQRKRAKNSLVILNHVLIDGQTCTGDVVIPEGVTKIGCVAFYSCTGLTSIVIPESVTSIGRYAFYDCAGLTSIVIPESVTSRCQVLLYYIKMSWRTEAS